MIILDGSSLKQFRRVSVRSLQNQKIPLYNQHVRFDLIVKFFFFKYFCAIFFFWNKFTMSSKPSYILFVNTGCVHCKTAIQLLKTNGLSDQIGCVNIDKIKRSNLPSSLKFVPTLMNVVTGKQYAGEDIYKWVKFMRPESFHRSSSSSVSIAKQSHTTPPSVTDSSPTEVCSIVPWDTYSIHSDTQMGDTFSSLDDNCANGVCFLFESVSEEPPTQQYQQQQQQHTSDRGSTRDSSVQASARDNIPQQPRRIATLPKELVSVDVSVQMSDDKATSQQMEAYMASRDAVYE